MISFINGLYFDLDSRVSRMIVSLHSKSYHQDIQKSFIPKTLEYLDYLKKTISTVLQSGDLDIAILANNNLYQFNELNELFQTIELYRYEVIVNYDAPEIYFNKKIARIYHEIRNLSIPPVITTISNSENYYWAHPVFEIIALPYGEENNLLNLPDLYHEIGHLIYKQYPNIVDSKFNPALDKYIKEETDRSYDEKTHEFYLPFYADKSKKWKDYWIEEFTCDLIATFLCGPAYAWANMKMSALSNGTNSIYTDTASHPSDEARMRAVFMMLNKLGFSSEGEAIKADWELFLQHTNNTKHPTYKFIYPDHLLNALTNIVYDYCIGIDLASYNDQVKTHGSPISKHINDAWDTLHSKPTDFDNYQKAIIAQLNKELA